MVRVLGVHVGHDSSAALVRDGEVVACAAEERFGARVKHYGGVPVAAIELCLKEGGVGLADVDEVAFTSSKTDGGPLRKLMNLEMPIEVSLVERALDGAADLYKRLRARLPDAPPLYYARWPTAKPMPTRAVDHHLAHAASAFYTSGLRAPTLVITADGIGDGTSLAVWRATPPANFEQLYRVGAEGSLGWFYGLVTEALGWWVGDGEGKTMGLAPYGSAEPAKGALDRFCPRYQDGRLATPHDFGTPSQWIEAGAYHWHFDEAEQVRALVEKHGRETIAAEAQRVLEREMVPFVKHWLEREKTRVACFAGGLMLNVKMNQRLWESGALDVQHIFPEAGDAGLAVGAALLGCAARGGPLGATPLRHCYWGPSYTDAAIEAILKERRLRYARVEDPAEAAAERLAKGAIVGWFQGRMEAGPRALGGRSILMDPTKPEAKDVINARVKFREPFRPFCPSMTPKAARQLLDPRARPERFMITSFDVRERERARIPAVVHVDGTARPQIVEEDQNPLYFRLLVAFGRRSGVECLLNTSFNVKGEPIVCTPREALRGFFDTGLDSLVIGSFVLDK